VYRYYCFRDRGEGKRIKEEREHVLHNGGDGLHGGRRGAAEGGVEGYPNIRK
jgi:hypothetical protein